MFIYHSCNRCDYYAITQLFTNIPLLFLIYINDISDHLSSLVRLFADDTSLSYSSTNLLQIERKLNSDMNILNTWAET